MSFLKTTAIQHLNGSSPNIYLDSNNRVGIGTSSPGYLLDIDQATNDAQNFRLKNEEVSLFLGTYGTGSSYPREVTINGSRADSGSLPNLRIAGQGGIKFCVDFNTERMNIDSSGRVTKPYQSYSLVTSTAVNVTIAANGIMPYDTVIYNVGNNYNTSTYRFTAPINGTYLITFYFYRNSAIGTEATICRNGSIIAKFRTYQTGSDETFKGSTSRYLSAGDYIDIRTINGITNFYGNAEENAAFSVYLLG